MTKTNVYLGILARKAELGKGKTRLAKGIGTPQAFEVYKHLIEVASSVTNASGLPCTVFFDPTIGDEHVWPVEDFDHAIQVQSSNLGDRIADALQRVLAKAKKPLNGKPLEMSGALIIGTDCPTLTPEIIQKAASALDSSDAVLGPTLDGGFYLLGLRKLEKTLFEGVSWSTDQVGGQMITAFERLGYTYQLLPKLSDIDEQEDWEKYQTWRSEKALKPVLLKDKTLS